MMKLSFVKGKGNLNHNNRVFSCKNVDQDRTSQNIVYISQSLESTYKDLFQKAIEDYNHGKKPSKQPYKDSNDYLNKMQHSKMNQKVFYENLVQIGTMHDAGCGTANAKVTIEVLEEYAKTFQERNPNLFLFNAVLHMDEATPHLHLNYVPIKHSQRGLTIQNSLTGVFKEMGFSEGKSKHDNSTMEWQRREREYIRELCLSHDIRLEQEQSTDRESLTPEQYRVAAEILENRVNVMIEREAPKVKGNRFSNNKNQVIEKLYEQNAVLKLSAQKDEEKFNQSILHEKERLQELETEYMQKIKIVEQKEADLEKREETIEQKEGTLEYTLNGGYKEDASRYRKALKYILNIMKQLDKGIVHEIIKKFELQDIVTHNQEKNKKVYEEERNT